MFKKIKNALGFGFKEAQELEKKPVDETQSLAEVGTYFEIDALHLETLLPKTMIEKDEVSSANIIHAIGKVDSSGSSDKIIRHYTNNGFTQVFYDGEEKHTNIVGMRFFVYLDTKQIFDVESYNRLFDSITQSEKPFIYRGKEFFPILTDVDDNVALQHVIEETDSGTEISKTTQDFTIFSRELNDSDAEYLMISLEEDSNGNMSAVYSLGIDLNTSVVKFPNLG